MFLYGDYLPLSTPVVSSESSVLASRDCGFADTGRPALGTLSPPTAIIDLVSEWPSFDVINSTSTNMQWKLWKMLDPELREDPFNQNTNPVN